MKLLKKVNRGIVLFICLFLIAGIYITVTTVEGNKLKKESNSLISEFVEKDIKWRKIPTEYYEDSQGYIKSIEKEVRNYFYSDDAYEFYIQNAILSQYDNKCFFTEIKLNYIDKLSGTEYDGKYIDCEVYISFDFAMSEENIDEFMPMDACRFKLIQTSEGLKICSHNYCFSDYIYKDDYFDIDFSF